MRDIGVISVKNYIQSFNKNIQKIRNPRPKHASSEKKRKTTAEDPKRRTEIEKKAILLYLKYITGLLSMIIS